MRTVTEHESNPSNMKSRKLKVKEFAEIVGGGTPSTQNSGYWDGDIPWITPKDLSGYQYRYISKGERNISEEGLARSSAKLVPEKTVLLTTRAPVGYVAIADNPISTNQGFKNLMCKPEKADPEFIYYLLKLNRELLESHATGSTYKELSKSRLEVINFKLPELSTQQRIASILSAYDNLIENNLRRIKLLEESARLLYKEWFVRLRFPGYEHTRIIDGVPEGWERKKLGDIASVVMGQSPQSQFYNEDGEGLPFHQGVSNFGDRFVTHSTFCTVSNRIAEPGDILCSVRAPVGRLNITLDKIVIGRGLSAIRSKMKQQSYLYYQLRKYFFKEDLIGGGAIFASVTKSQLLSQELITASENLIREFEEIVKPIDKQIQVLNMQDHKLRKARDILLPKLMSGKIEL